MSYSPFLPNMGMQRRPRKCTAPPPKKWLNSLVHNQWLYSETVGYRALQYGQFQNKVSKGYVRVEACMYLGSQGTQKCIQVLWEQGTQGFHGTNLENSLVKLFTELLAFVAE